MVRRPAGVEQSCSSDAERDVWRRIVGLGACGTIVYVVVRAVRGSTRARLRTPPRWLAVDRTPGGSAPDPLVEAPTPHDDAGADVVELCGFAVTCPRCGDRTHSAVEPTTGHSELSRIG
jgi:hypothetical protein